jgi:cephalosporin hydroxylase
VSRPDSENVPNPPEDPFFDVRPEEDRIVRDFFELYYSHWDRTIESTHWLGARVVKCPLDFWVYQEILFERRPDVIVETGTAFGGSALFLASVCDLIGGGRIVTIDIEPRDGLPTHPRITYLAGDSAAPEIVSQVRESIAEGDEVMVILDSKHHRDHVLAEMRAYGPLVTPGQYLVAEDTTINLTVPKPKDRPYPRPGPRDAVDEFLAEQDRFVLDRSREKFFMTVAAGGFLRCVR